MKKEFKEELYYEDDTPFYGLFKEIPMSGQAFKQKLEPLYTIKEYDTDLPSAHRIYMASQTEYAAAMELTGSWEYWRGMLKSIKIRRVINLWREEKLLQDQSRARELLWKVAIENNNVSAMKVLYESKREEAAQRKRSTAEDVQQAQEREILTERLNRLTQLKAVK